MRTRLLQVHRDQPDLAAIQEARAILERGGLVAFATETVYGLGAIATDEQAVARIFHAKGRPAFNPLIVHVADADHARTLTSEWPTTAGRLAEHFWPGPLTLVLRACPIIPKIVTAGKDTVAIRSPATGVAQALIRETHRPLAAPSANRSNRLSPTSAEHVLADLDGIIDLVLDSGPTALGIESTVLDLVSTPARILRPGPIGLDALASRLKGSGQVTDAVAHPEEGSPSSPGMLEVHYSPRTKALRTETISQLMSFRWPRSATLLVFGDAPVPVLPDRVDCIRFDAPESAAESLYRILHELDARHQDVIVVLMPPATHPWAAVRDRLIRACRPMSDLG